MYIIAEKQGEGDLLISITQSVNVPQGFVYTESKFRCFICVNRPFGLAKRSKYDASSFTFRVAFNP